MGGFVFSPCWLGWAGANKSGTHHEMSARYTLFFNSTKTKDGNARNKF